METLPMAITFLIEAVEIILEAPVSSNAVDRTAGVSLTRVVGIPSTLSLAIHRTRFPTE